MSKMSLHGPFGWLKHKLWPKKGSTVKLPIWLSTTKSWESPGLPCVQEACHILLKSSQQGLQLCFKPHLNLKFSHKVMGHQSHGSLNFANFETPTWESRDKMWEGAGFPQVQAMVSPKSLCLLVIPLCIKGVIASH
jgi:hypothetical protein